MGDPRPSLDLTVVLTIVLGIAASIWVGLDGEPAWRLSRVALVLAATLGVLWWEANAGLRVRGWLALGCGLVGAVVGAGLGPPHLAKAGLTAPTVVAMTILLVGLALMAAGAVALLRPLGVWRRLIAVSGIVLLVGVLAWTFSPMIAAVNVPPTSVGDASPAERELAYRDVTFETADGVRLAGWYVPSASGAAVVLRHGAGSTRASLIDHAAVLSAHGYGTLLVDARGHGDSRGRAMDLGWYGDLDTSAAVTFLAGQPDVDPGRIGVLGLSMGGEEAIGAAAADLRIRAVVAEGATGRSDADHRWYADEYGIRGWLQEQLERAQYALVDLLTDAPKPRSLAAAVSASAAPPMLLIASGAVPDEAKVATLLQARAPDRVETWIVPDASHTGGLSHRPEEWERRVVAFLDRALS